MWKVGLQRSVKQLRFVLKSEPEHHGTWRFLNKHFAELQTLSPNMFISLNEIPNDYESNSSIFFLYGDLENTQDQVLTEGKSYEEIVEIIKSKVSYGSSLPRQEIKSNDDRNIPIDIVEAHTYRKNLDDAF